MRFTDRFIKALQPKDKRYEVIEEGGQGLRMRISVKGVKTWALVYRFTGKLQRLTLGRYPTMSVKDAHAEAGLKRNLINRGTNPAVEKRLKKEAAIKAPTVEQLVDEYIERHAKIKKKSWGRDLAILNRDVIPHIGHQKAKDIKRRDIVAILDSIIDRDAPIAANRAFAVIRKMFNFALERDVIDSSPCYLLKAPAKERQRDRVLTEDEMKKLWHGLGESKISLPVQIAVKLILVTAQRKGEVINAKWQEFDLKNGWWTIPAERVKNKMSHRVALSELALELLGNLKTYLVESEYLFPSTVANKPILDTAVDRAIRRNWKQFGIDHLTPHDLRRSTASYMTSAGVPRLVVSKILNHAESGITAVYDRHSYDKEKRQALILWAGKLERIISSEPTSNIISLIH